MERTCRTCKHRNVNGCLNCEVVNGFTNDPAYGYSNWEPDAPPVFEIGRVVKLKSGGPEMTVEGEDKSTFGNSNEVAVTWFDVNGLLCRSTINKSCLEVVR